MPRRHDAATKRERRRDPAHLARLGAKRATRVPLYVVDTPVTSGAARVHVGPAPAPVPTDAQEGN